MAKTQNNGRSTAKTRASTAATVHGRSRMTASKAHPDSVATASGWANDLVFDVREPKLAVSLRLDADVLRFFRGFGAGYQTRINEVLKAFMHAREDGEVSTRAVVAAKASRVAANGNGKRAR